MLSKLNTTKVPAQIFEFICPNCGSRAEYPLFLASFYNFNTYIELKSNTLVRIDLEYCHHKKIDTYDVLKEYSIKNNLTTDQHMWINLEETKFCLKCKSRFFNEDKLEIRFCVEEEVDAVLLPGSKNI